MLIFMEESKKKMYLKFEKEKKKRKREKRKKAERVVRILLHWCPERIDAHTTYPTYPWNT